jgi:acyl-CoA reductase-like NAD-dependent aldehyde dehydrogenase
MSTIRLGELGMEAGLPPGALSIVTGYGHEAGAALTAHPGIHFATFTGSPEVGTLIQQATARHHIPCMLELRGKSPHIVFDDADMDKAVPVIVKAIVQNAGQTCAAGSRLLVQQNIYDRFIAHVAAAFNETRVGTPEMGGRQARVSRRIVSGHVFINCYGGGGVELPFGGFKRSGHGREKGLLALEEMSTTKTIVQYYN